MKKHPDFGYIYDMLSFERHEEVGKSVSSRRFEGTMSHVCLQGISALSHGRFRWHGNGGGGWGSF